MGRKRVGEGEETGRRHILKVASQDPQKALKDLILNAEENAAKLEAAELALERLKFFEPLLKAEELGPRLRKRFKEKVEGELGRWEIDLYEYSSTPSINFWPTPVAQVRSLNAEKTLKELKDVVKALGRAFEEAEEKRRTVKELGGARDLILMLAGFLQDFQEVDDEDLREGDTEVSGDAE